MTYSDADSPVVVIDAPAEAIRICERLGEIDDILADAFVQITNGEYVPTEMLIGEHAALRERLQKIVDEELVPRICAALDADDDAIEDDYEWIRGGC
jgi:hypothetical protein